MNVRAHFIIVANSDFMIRLNGADRRVTLNPGTETTKTVKIAITNDMEFEGTEYFTLKLNFIGGSGDTRRLKLYPSNATVTILDNDSEHVI